MSAFMETGLTLTYFAEPDAVSGAGVYRERHHRVPWFVVHGMAAAEAADQVEVSRLTLVLATISRSARICARLRMMRSPALGC